MNTLASGLMGMRALATLQLIYLLVVVVLLATAIWIFVAFSKVKHQRVHWFRALLSTICAFAFFVVVAFAIFWIAESMLQR